MKKCKICGSTFGVKVGLCNRHYIQKSRGGIMERTKFDKNEIVNTGNYSEIYLYDKNHKISGKSKIDNKIVNIVSYFKWFLQRGYARTKKDGMSLHGLIMGTKEGKVIDHINRDKLDNRIRNLRHVTQQQNTLNCNLSKNNKSGINGVYFRKDTRKWSAQIKINRKSINLGSFSTIEDATAARLAADKKYKINQKL